MLISNKPRSRTRCDLCAAARKRVRVQPWVGWIEREGGGRRYQCRREGGISKDDTVKNIGLVAFIRRWSGY